MPVVHKSIIASYSAEQIYSLVTDVQSYPNFIAACSAGSIDKVHDDGYTATLAFALAGIGQSFTTRNVAVPHESISMNLVKGPFKYLNGQWKFRQLGENACKVEFELDYEFSLFFMNKLTKSTFNKIAESMVDTFHAEAIRKFGSAANH